MTRSIDIGSKIVITHQGVIEVEKALSNLDKPTQYFPPAVNIIAIDKMINSQIQQASPSATQVVTIDEKRYDELKEIINTLNKSIDELSLKRIHRTDLQAEIQTIEAQMSSSNPKAAIITESLKYVKRILEGVTGSTLAYTLINQITLFFGG